MTYFVHRTSPDEGRSYVSVNASHIQVIAQGNGVDYSYVYFDSDHWLEVTESYDEIKMMLTDRLVANLKKSEVKGLPDKMIDRLEKRL